MSCCYNDWQTWQSETFIDRVIFSVYSLTISHSSFNTRMNTCGWPSSLTTSDSCLFINVCCQLQKEKEKAERMQQGPTYKVYAMKDYKKLKLEYKLGGLGPSQDPAALKEKVSFILLHIYKHLPIRACEIFNLLSCVCIFFHMSVFAVICWWLLSYVSIYCRMLVWQHMTANTNI